MMEHGATRLDKGTHNLIRFWKDNHSKNLTGMVRVGEFVTTYHEERLYSVYDERSQTVTIVYAKSPYAAIDKVMGGKMVMA